MTYSRPESLTATLTAISRQTRAVDSLVVVDNGSERHAKAAAGAVGATYLDARDNLGPAGGIALGMSYVLDLAADEDWLVLFDDDDPPGGDGLLAHLWGFALGQFRTDPRTGAVGLVGARYDRQRGVTRRVPDAELSGPVLVDYIGGGQFPMYRCAALKDAGVFDRNLFFGFDDLEHGLRLRLAGYSLYVDGDLWLRERQRHGRTGLDGKRIRTREDTASWRRYYSARNAVLVAKRHASRLATVIVSLGLATRSFMYLLRPSGPASGRILMLRGVLDGVLGRTGRRVDPGLGAKSD